MVFVAADTFHIKGGTTIYDSIFHVIIPSTKWRDQWAFHSDTGVSADTTTYITFFAADSVPGPPTITVQPVSIRMHAGGTVTHSVTATSAATPSTITCQWYKKQVGGSYSTVGTNSNTFSYTTVRSDTFAICSVTVSDVNGTTGSNVAIDTVWGFTKINNHSRYDSLAYGDSVYGLPATQGACQFLFNASPVSPMYSWSSNYVSAAACNAGFAPPAPPTYPKYSRRLMESIVIGGDTARPYGIGWNGTDSINIVQPH